MAEDVNYLNVNYNSFNMKTKSVTITEEQQKWIEKNAINLSKYVRMKLDETMSDGRSRV